MLDMKPNYLFYTVQYYKFLKQHKIVHIHKSSKCNKKMASQSQSKFKFNESQKLNSNLFTSTMHGLYYTTNWAKRTEYQRPCGALTGGLQYYIV